MEVCRKIAPGWEVWLVRFYETEEGATGQGESDITENCCYPLVAGVELIERAGAEGRACSWIFRVSIDKPLDTRAGDIREVDIVEVVDDLLRA